jgi:hypothetical protein
VRQFRSLSVLVVFSFLLFFGLYGCSTNGETADSAEEPAAAVPTEIAADQGEHAALETADISGNYAEVLTTIELLQDLDPNKHKYVADATVTYPIWLSPGTDESILFKVAVSEEVGSAIDRYERVDVSPFEEPTAGKLAEHTSQIAIGDLVNVQINAPAFQVYASAPDIQAVEGPGKELLWVWSVVAPENPGNYRVNISVFLDAQMEELSWLGSFQIIVQQPPTETAEPTATPTITPTPTETPLPTATLPTGAKFIEDIKENTEVKIEILLAIFTGLAGISLPLVRFNIQRAEKIKAMRAELAVTDSPETAFRLQRLESYKWWQVWKTLDWD